MKHEKVLTYVPVNHIADTEYLPNSSFKAILFQIGSVSAYSSVHWTGLIGLPTIIP